MSSSPSAAFSDSFALVKARQESDWLKSVRHHAFERFITLGLPTTKNEQWRYTSLLGLSRIPFQTMSRNGDQKRLQPFPKSAQNIKVSDFKKYFFPDLVCHRLVFIDGL